MSDNPLGSNAVKQTIINISEDNPEKTRGPTFILPDGAKCTIGGRVRPYYMYPELYAWLEVIPASPSQGCAHTIDLDVSFTGQIRLNTERVLYLSKHGKAPKRFRDRLIPLSEAIERYRFRLVEND